MSSENPTSGYPKIERTEEGNLVLNVPAHIETRNVSTWFPPIPGTPWLESVMVESKEVMVPAVKIPIRRLGKGAIG